MNNVLGDITTMLGLVVSSVAAVLAFVAAATDRGGFRRLALDLTFGVLGAALLACGVMELALITHDFSVPYVAQERSRETPLLFTVASL